MAPVNIESHVGKIELAMSASVQKIVVIEVALADTLADNSIK